MRAPPRPDYWANAVITHTMADSRRETWERVLAPYQQDVKYVLEIGSYEGQSALFWCNFFPDAHVTCVDSWEDKDVAKGCTSGREVESHFDKNTLGLPVTKMKLKSTAALVRLATYTFDFIYVDGDHTRLQVMTDSCLAWGLLRSGGIMVWDDYRDYRPDLIDRPTPAIDAFVFVMKSDLEIIHDSGQQLIVRKR